MTTENTTPTKALSQRQQQSNMTDMMRPLLPSSIDPDRFKAFALSLLRDKKLSNCSEKSKLTALADCAKLGLYPDRNLGHAWLVPFKTEVTLIVGYQGYIELARRSGVITTVETEIVFERDEFDVWTDAAGRHLKHRPGPTQFATDAERGIPVGVYCVAVTRTGCQIETMSWREVLNTRSRSPSWRSKPSQSPWTTDLAMMARKSVVRRARKYWPQSPELAALGDWDDRAEGLIVEPAEPTTVTPAVVTAADLMGDGALDSHDDVDTPTPANEDTKAEADDPVADQFEDENEDDPFGLAGAVFSVAASDKAVDNLVASYASSGDHDADAMKEIIKLGEVRKQQLKTK